MTTIPCRTRHASDAAHDDNPAELTTGRHKATPRSLIRARLARTNRALPEQTAPYTPGCQSRALVLFPTDPDPAIKHSRNGLIDVQT